MSPIPELFDSDFNSIFNSANLLYMRDTFLTMINYYLEATLDHFKSQAQFKIDRSRGAAECRSSV